MYPLTNENSFVVLRVHVPLFYDGNWLMRSIFKRLKIGIPTPDTKNPTEWQNTILKLGEDDFFSF